MADKAISVRNPIFTEAFPGSEAIELPNGKAVFHKLDLDDLGDWSSQMHNDWKKRNATQIPPGVKGVERFQINRIIEFSSPTLDDIADSVYRSEGVKEALKRSLMKGGITEAQALASIKQIPPNTAVKLAKWCVNLFEVRVPTKDPNEGREAASATAVGSSGSISGQSLTPDGPDKLGSVPPLQ